MVSEPPLVGREEELNRLGSMLPSVLRGSGRLVLISGEAGIGKTRLVIEFEKVARAQGCKMIVGGCLPSARIPYLPFLDALNDLFEETSEKRSGGKTSRFLSSAKKAAPDMLEAVPVLGNILKGSAVFMSEYRGAGEEQAEEHVLFAILELLKKESAKRPLIIFLDDLQWADNATVGMLHFLAREAHSMPIMILGTYRPEDIFMDKKAGGNPFLDSLRVMKREGLCDEIILHALSQPEVNQVVSAMLEKPVDDLVVDRIFRESGGRPLFAVETVRLMESRGALAFKEGRWSISGHAPVEIPQSVKEVHMRRIERITKDDKRILEYASVIGHVFSIEILADLLKIERLDLLEALERLHNDHQLVHEVEGAYEFEDEDLRRVTYDSVSKLRRKEVHRAVANIMEKGDPNLSSYPEMARHYQAAGELAKATRYFLEAGDAELTMHELSAALPHFEAALEMSSKEASLSNERPRALEGVADCQLGRDLVRADALYQELLSLDHDQMAGGRILRKRAVCWLPFTLGMGDASKATSLLDQAVGIDGDDQMAKGEVSLVRAMIALQNGDVESMRACAAEAHSSFAGAGEAKKASLVDCFEALGLVQAGFAVENLESPELALTPSDGADHSVAMETALVRGVGKWLQGETPEGLVDLTRSVEAASSLGDLGMLAESLLWRGRAYLDAGMVEKAMRDFCEAEDHARSLKSYFDAELASVLQGTCYLRLGDLTRAEERYAAAMRASSSIHGFASRALAMYSENGNARVLAEKGELGKAAEAFERGLKGLSEATSALRFAERVWRPEYARVLRKMGRVEEALVQEERARDIFRAFGDEWKAEGLS